MKFISRNTMIDFSLVFWLSVIPIIKRLLFWSLHLSSYRVGFEAEWVSVVFVVLCLSPWVDLKVLGLIPVRTVFQESSWVQPYKSRFCVYARREKRKKSFFVLVYKDETWIIIRIQVRMKIFICRKFLSVVKKSFSANLCTTSLESLLGL